MADVIHLNERSQRSARKAQGAKSPSDRPLDRNDHAMAVVLMFTGIRYERLEQTSLTVIADPTSQGAGLAH